MKEKDFKKIHEVVEDYMNCINKKSCLECKCYDMEKESYYLCCLLSFYKDKIIDKIFDAI